MAQGLQPGPAAKCGDALTLYGPRLGSTLLFVCIDMRRASVCRPAHLRLATSPVLGVPCMKELGVQALCAGLSYQFVSGCTHECPEYLPGRYVCGVMLHLRGLVGGGGADGLSCTTHIN